MRKTYSYFYITRNISTPTYSARAWSGIIARRRSPLKKMKYGVLRIK